MRSTEQAIAFARTLHNRRTPIGVGKCLLNARTAYQIPAAGDVDGDGDADAVDGMRTATLHRAVGTAHQRRGGFVWWTGGANGYGHVAIPTGDGSCWTPGSPDRPGEWDRMPIDEITRRWGLTLAGWSPDFNGVTVWVNPASYDRTRGPNVDAAIASLRKAKGRGARKAAISAALAALTGLRTWRRKP